MQWHSATDVQKQTILELAHKRKEEHRLKYGSKLKFD
jgi:predicted Fe-S protein YdhL (DUF1289 family)